MPRYCLSQPIIFALVGEYQAWGSLGWLCETMVVDMVFPFVACEACHNGFAATAATNVRTGIAFVLVLLASEVTRVRCIDPCKRHVTH